MAIPQGQAKGTIGAALELFEPSKVIVKTRQPVANGVAAVERTLTLSRNAIVEPPFNVQIAAGVAEWAASQNVGQVRAQATSGSGAQAVVSMVVDFGVLRTVGGVAVIDPAFQITQVKPWAGAAFADKPIFDGTAASQLGFGSDTVAMFPSEVRTERLQIDLKGSSTPPGGDELFVRLPDVPADLDLRINDSPPVWTARGAVVEGSNQWTAGPTGLLVQPPVDISAALNGFVGDAGASKEDTVDLRITLTARVPGALELTLPSAAAQTIRFIVPVPFDQGTREIKTAEEGRVIVPLPLPDWVVHAEKVDATMTGNLPPERVMPPLGPDELTVAGSTTPFAEIMFDPDHAACVELLAAQNLVELVGVRLPLRAGLQGAEMRAMLLARDEDNEPASAIDGAISTPVSIEAPPGSQDVWVSFAFASPVPIDPQALPFVAAVVSRGTVSWSLGSAADPSSAGRVRRGAPTGPWELLPDDGPLASLRGRVRLVGHGSHDAPVAPLQIEARGAGGAQVHPPVDVTPTPKGVAFEWAADPAALVTPRTDAGKKIVDLYVVSRAVGAATLRDVRVIATDK